MDKLAEVLHVMNLDLNKFRIDNKHQLPSNMSGPKPVIVKFVSYLDKTRVWNRKHLLGHSSSRIYIREHYSAQIEANIRKLLPIKRAIDQQMKVRLLEDRLAINSQLYTIENLHQH